jgi:DNA-binding beta-propeller fold protein YncE
MNRPTFKAWSGLRAAMSLALTGAALLPRFPAAAQAQVVVVGNDDMALVVNGQLTIDVKGKQSISIIDVSGPTPRLKASLDVPNSLFGPPTNIQVTPDDKLALVAESLRLNEDNSKWVPSDKVHVIDLQANPPKEIDVITVGQQPSGMAISHDGKLALIANRAETSVSVLSIDGKTVKFLGKVDTKDQVTHVAITPDGKRALVNKATSNKVSFLAIDGTTVTYTGPDITVGWYPYVSDITPDGKLALVANTGNNSRSDGNEDSLTIIDLEAKPPHVIAHIPAGEGPEGLVISPTGKVAAAGNLCGTDAPAEAWFHKDKGCIRYFGIEGKTVTPLGELPAGPIAEALIFSPDGKWLLVGSLNEKDIWTYRVDGTKITPSGQPIALPGHPAAMGTRAR